ncbi:MAG: sulfatase [Candidatus Eisenbacteria bacterium]
MQGEDRESARGGDDARAGLHPREAGASVRFGLIGLISTIAGLWTLDVLVNLRLISAALVPRSFIGGPRHFAGMLVCQIEAAFLVTAAILSLGFLISRLRGALGPRRESVALLAAALAGLAIPMRIVGKPHAPHTAAVLASVVIAFLVWILLRFLLRRRALRAWSLGATMGIALPVSLVAGLLNNAVIRSIYHSGSIVLDVVLAIFFVAVGILVWRLEGEDGYGESRFLRPVLGWLPVLLATGTAILFCIVSARFGLPAVAEGAVPQAEAARRPDAPPSIVLIVLDTVRADHLQHYGYARNTMPAFERWAAGGLIAERAVAPAGWTTPSHASMFSGRTVSRHRVHYSREQRSFMSRPAADIAWLPARLVDQGYHCLAVTANRLALPAPRIGFHHVLVPSHQPFEYVLAAAFDRALPWFRRWSEMFTWRNPNLHAGDLTDVILRALPAADRRRGAAPLFLFVNYIDAHAPYNPPPAALTALGVDPRPPFGRYEKHRDLTQAWPRLPEQKWQALSDLYDGDLRWLDMHLERLLAYLEQSLGERALIIVVSDHGEELGEEGRIGHEYGLDQRIIHVPLCIRGAGLVPGQIDEVITIRRLYDFVLRVAGGGSSATRAVAEVLRTGDEFGTLAERYPSGNNAAFLGDAYLRHWVAWTGDRYKVIGPQEEGLQVYDIAASGFRDGPALDDSTAAPELRAALAFYWRTYRDLEDAEAGEEPREEELERLRSLGYIK